MWPTNLAKNLGKDDFKYLIQEFDIIVRDLVKQKGFSSILNGNNISEKEYILLLGDIFLEIIALRIMDYIHVIIWAHEV